MSLEDQCRHGKPFSQCNLHPVDKCKYTPYCITYGEHSIDQCQPILIGGRAGQTIPVHDPVNHPSHYTNGKLEVIEVLEDWMLPFHLSNAIKYIARCFHKGNVIQDLKKAVWYINRYIEYWEKKERERDTVAN